MRRIALTVIVLTVLSGCTTRQPSSAALDRSVNAVVVDEIQRQKVIQAASAGATPDQALAKAADGPKDEKPFPK